VEKILQFKGALIMCLGILSFSWSVNMRPIHDASCWVVCGIWCSSVWIVYRNQTPRPRPRRSHRCNSELNSPWRHNFNVHVIIRPGCHLKNHGQRSIPTMEPMQSSSAFVKGECSLAERRTQSCNELIQCGNPSTHVCQKRHASQQYCLSIWNWTYRVSWYLVCIYITNNDRQAWCNLTRTVNQIDWSVVYVTKQRAYQSTNEPTQYKLKHQQFEILLLLYSFWPLFQGQRVKDNARNTPEHPPQGQWPQNYQNRQTSNFPSRYNLTTRNLSSNQPIKFQKWFHGKFSIQHMILASNALEASDLTMTMKMYID
jgi:hypothetical protein